jgi:hypothetical protein
LRSAELLGRACDFSQFLQLLTLLVDEEFGITDDVDEENMPDLELYVWRMLRRHEASYYLKTRDFRVYFGATILEQAT